MTANRVYAMSAITALTAQNTTGVTDIMEVSPKFLAEQLDGIFTDIYPDAVKTGMVASGELIQVIADKLTEYKAGNLKSTSCSRCLPCPCLPEDTTSRG